MLVGVSEFWRQKDRFPKGSKFHILWWSSPLYLGDKTKTKPDNIQSINQIWEEKKKKRLSSSWGEKEECSCLDAVLNGNKSWSVLLYSLHHCILARKLYYSVIGCMTAAVKLHMYSKTLNVTWGWSWIKRNKNKGKGNHSSDTANICVCFLGWSHQRDKGEGTNEYGSAWAVLSAVPWLYQGAGRQCTRKSRSCLKTTSLPSPTSQLSEIGWWMRLPSYNFSNPAPGLCRLHYWAVRHWAQLPT